MIGEFSLKNGLNDNAHFPIDDKYIVRYQQYLKNKEVKKEEEIVNNRNGKDDKIDNTGRQEKVKGFVNIIKNLFKFLQ